MSQGTSSAGEGFGSDARLKRRTDFRRIQSKGRRVHTTSFIVVLSPTQAPAGRLGITVTKKVGNAPARNRIKRVVREVFRRNRELFPAENDIVFIAKRNLGALSYASLLDEVRRASKALFRASARLRPSETTEAPGASQASSDA